MTSMREKMARAMHDVTPFKNTEGEYDQQSPEYQRMCLLLADAGLDALMEPTEGMFAVPGDGPATSRRVFRAMIQAAKDGA